jgi:hypothetical protein
MTPSKQNVSYLVPSPTVRFQFFKCASYRSSGHDQPDQWTCGLPLLGLHYHTNPFCIEVASIEIGKTKVNVSGGKLLAMAETNITVPQLAPVL